MRRFLVTTAVALAGFFAIADQASACSCVAPAPGEESSLRGLDAAVTGRLIESTRQDDQTVEVTYRILRVYKGGNRYHLREGGKLSFETSRYGSACGVPRHKGKRYGLGLNKFRGELAASLCSVTSPKAMHEAAENSGNARRSAAAGCSASA